MRKSLSVALLLLAWPALADPPHLEIPPEVRPAGVYARMLPSTDAVAIIYVGIDGLEPIPSELLRDPRLFLMDCYGRPAGRYRFAAVAASKSGEQARADFVLVLGDAPVPPPGPGPTPPPPPPPPTDPLVSGLQAHYDADQTPGKADSLKALAELYRQASTKLADDQTLKTNAAMLGALRRAVSGELGTDALHGVRERIATELDTLLGTSAGAAVDRAKVKAAFARVGKCLLEVKP